MGEMVHFEELQLIKAKGASQGKICPWYLLFSELHVLISVGFFLFSATKYGYMDK